jgi:uncharacterized zinc-type alcohol dehydrogenase-like protein
MNPKNTHITAWAANQSGKQLKPWTYTLESLSPHDIDIAITHCGVCHSDLDILNNTWHDTQYPAIPGHEIIGIVLAIGSEVTQFQLGKRVGVSWQQYACGHCGYCKTDKEQFCPELKAVGIHSAGGFADKIRVPANFVYSIPDELPSELAVPILCAGATVYQALRTYPLRNGMKVAVIGMGGLGHLAVQFLTKLGCQVTVFELSADKKDDAHRFGATEFVIPDYPAPQESFHFILSTADTVIDLEYFIRCLKPEGTLCFAGMPAQPMVLPLFLMIIGQKSITAANLGSRQNIIEALEFVTRHQIKPQIELLPLSSVNQALDRLHQHKARYRIVLHNNR